MRSILRLLKRIWLINFIRRLWVASKYFNKRYIQILKWGFKSKEDTNFTYHLTPDNLLYLAQAIAVVTKKSSSEILDFFKEAESDNDLLETIDRARESSQERKFADKEIRFGKRLGWYAFVRATKPQVVIETGVDKGLGSIILCAALMRNKEEGFEGKYYGTDINPKAGYMLSGKYKEIGEILYGDSIESLTQFNQKIDLFINDSDHSSEYEYNEYKTIVPLISDSTIILGDNSHCSNKLSQFSAENNRNFIYFQEVPEDHWYPGAGIGISYKEN